MDKEPKNADLELQIITTKRDHLAEIAHAIANGMEPNFFNLKHDPITVTVHGSHHSGKKVISDEMLAQLKKASTDVVNHSMMFTPLYSEMNFQGQDITYRFLDIFYHANLNEDEWRSARGKNRIHETTKLLSLDFIRISATNFNCIQNTHKIGDNDPWLSLFVKKHHKANYNPATEQDFNPVALDFFKTYAKTHPERNNWLRLVELKVYKDTLLNAVKFTDAFNTLAKRPHIKAMAGKKPVHIWA